MKKYPIIASVFLCSLVAKAELPPPPPSDPAFDEQKRAIEEECQAKPPCDEEKILCFIRRAHELQESGAICPEVAHRLIREGELRLAFRRGFEEGRFAGRGELCGPPKNGPKPPEGQPGEEPGDDSGEKVALCHVPPGNPDNAHTIRVSSSAVAAHLAHGDYEGECKNSDSSSKNKGASDKSKRGKKDKSSGSSSKGKSQSKKSSKK